MANNLPAALKTTKKEPFELGLETTRTFQAGQKCCVVQSHRPGRPALLKFPIVPTRACLPRQPSAWHVLGLSLA